MQGPSPSMFHCHVAWSSFVSQISTRRTSLPIQEALGAGENRYKVTGSNSHLRKMSDVSTRLFEGRSVRLVPVATLFICFTSPSIMDQYAFSSMDQDSENDTSTVPASFYVEHLDIPPGFLSRVKTVSSHRSSTSWELTGAYGYPVVSPVNDVTHHKIQPDYLPERDTLSLQESVQLPAQVLAWNQAYLRTGANSLHLDFNGSGSTRDIGAKEWNPSFIPPESSSHLAVGDYPGATPYEPLAYPGAQAQIVNSQCSGFSGYPPFSAVSPSSYLASSFEPFAAFDSQWFDNVIPAVLIPTVPAVGSHNSANGFALTGPVLSVVDGVQGAGQARDLAHPRGNQEHKRRRPRAHGKVVGSRISRTQQSSQPRRSVAWSQAEFGISSFTSCSNSANDSASPAEGFQSCVTLEVPSVCHSNQSPAPKSLLSSAPRSLQADTDSYSVAMSKLATAIRAVGKPHRSRIQRDCYEQNSPWNSGASTLLSGKDDFVVKLSWNTIASNITQKLQDWRREKTTSDEAREEAGYLQNQLIRLVRGKFLGNWVPQKGSARRSDDVVQRDDNRHTRRINRKRQVLRLLKLATDWLQERDATQSDAALTTYARSKEIILLHLLTETLKRLMDYLEDLAPTRKFLAANDTAAPCASSMLPPTRIREASPNL